MICLGNMTAVPPKCLVVSAGSWHLAHTAKGLHAHNGLAELWTSDRNKVGLPDSFFRQAKPFFWLTKPMYLLASAYWNEWWFWRMTWLWGAWVRRQRFPEFNVAHARMGYGLEVFDVADRVGALKVVDYCNSHPSSQQGYWQRECDLWASGSEPIMPRAIFRRMNQEIHRADLHLCPSDFVRDSLLLNGVAPEKCVIRPFGFDPSVFTAATLSKGQPKFIFTGSICLRKGCHYLLRAFEQVKKECPQAELILVGGVCEDVRPIFNRWRHLVTHVPWAPQARVADLMRECIAMVMPSLEEGMARVLIEGMACGLPLIASFESGATPLAAAGRELLLVNPHDPQDIAEKMLFLARNPEKASAMSAAAIARASEIGSWSSYSGRILADYDRFLEAKRSRGAAR